MLHSLASSASRTSEKISFHNLMVFPITVVSSCISSSLKDQVSGCQSPFQPHLAVWIVSMQVFKRPKKSQLRVLLMYQSEWRSPWQPKELRYRRRTTDRLLFTRQQMSYLGPEKLSRKSEKIKYTSPFEKQRRGYFGDPCYCHLEAFGRDFRR